MTPDQLELLSDMVADKVFQRIQEYMDDNYKNYISSFEPIGPIGPSPFFHRNIDAFGNIRFEPPIPPSKKEVLERQLKELEFRWKELLKEEKYELLKELKEIYEKIKKDYDSL